MGHRSIFSSINNRIEAHTKLARRAWLVLLMPSLVLLGVISAAVGADANCPPQPQPISVNGVFPNLTVFAEGVGSDSEAGIGALIPWADKLWATGYVAHIKGAGLGLYEITDDMKMTRHPEAVTGTFTNRMAHWPSGQAFIGPHAIDADGNVRTIQDLKNFRLTATVNHLTDPENKVYFLGNGTWMPYKTVTVSSKGYEHHEFPDAFSAHWVRIRAGDACIATAYFMYN